MFTGHVAGRAGAHRFQGIHDEGSDDSAARLHYYDVIGMPGHRAGCVILGI